jgi:3',5'-cyclic AMP phosphodiesterase CpdA
MRRRPALPFVVGGNFSYPTNVGGVDLNATYGGLSYSFDYNNVRFVLIDQFENANPGGNTSSAPLQQSWITQQLADTNRPRHAFVFDHKNLLGGNHKDNIMGAAINSSDPGDGAGVNFSSLSTANQTALLAKQQAEDAFINSLATNNVHFYISGHDHHHYDSIVQSPLGTNRVHQIISASDSSKFYTPTLPVSTNDTPVSQDLYKVGYYIYTVDGPRVTVDYYGVDVTTNSSFVVSSSTESIVTKTPVLTGNWRKILTYGYSLNGGEFIVPEGGSYAGVADNTAKTVASGETNCVGTAMQILAGVNASTATNNYGKAHSKAVNTGWAPAATNTASDILTLWGTSEIGTNQTDTIALSLSYTNTGLSDIQLASGVFVLAGKDTNGNWVNAVTLNNGGNAQFVFGSYSTNYPLGTYGVDTNSSTVWAVINYSGDFAATTVARRSDLSTLRIATLSDIHFFATNLLVSDGTAFQTYLAQDRKLLAQSAAIAKAAVDAVIAQEPDIVLLSGDLTKDGELDSHVGVSNLLTRLTAAGVQVFVVPGNHDINNTNAVSFDGANTTPVDNVTPAQFRAIYAPYGYNQAVAKDPSSLSYIVEPVTGLWIFCMDSCQYTSGEDPTAGSFPAARLNWITNELAVARAQGKVVVGMMHHGILEHFSGQKTLFPDYVIDDYTNVASLFAAGGMKAVFTGHFHAQDVAKGTFNGNTLYDIETGSSVTYPCPYRVLDLETNGQLVIASHPITAVNYDLGGTNFHTYAYNFLTNGMLTLSTYMLESSPFSLPTATATYLAPAVTEALIDHYAGDEPGLGGASASTRTIVTSLLSGDAASQELGGAIYSILTDPAPADNNLTLALAASVSLSGPASGTTLSNSAATLTWDPVWGSSVYYVTVTGDNYTNVFNVTGTSLTLPSILANGDYTWTVTTDTGVVSGTGTFTLAVPPELGITGPDTDGYVHVHWPVACAGYTLQFSSDLSGTNWVPVSTNGFFRLVK